MKISELTKDKYELWDLYVAQHKQGKIYHTLAWKKIFEQAFGRRSYYYFVEDDDGRIQGILLLIHFHTFIAGKQLISLPYVNYGGPIWSTDKAKGLILKTMNQLLQDTNSEVIEIRYDQPAIFNLPVRTNKVTFYLNLPDDPDVLLKSFKAKLRSQIKRPTKEGMYVKIGHLNLIDDFYYVFCRNMRHLGTPVYAKSVFKNILTLLPNQTYIVVVYTKNHLPVASAFLIGYKERMEIPWASSLRKFNRFSPNMLLYWEVMRLAIEKGYKVFDFGRGTKNGGTYRFKKQWGGEEKQLYWYYVLKEQDILPEVNKENPKFNLAIKIWQKLPLWFTNLVGPSLVRQIP